MENQGRNVSYESSEMGDEGRRNVNRRAGEITSQPQLFKDDFTSQGTNKESSDNWPDFSSSGQGTNYNQQTRNEGYVNQGYKASGDEGYVNQGYKASGDEGYVNQGYKASGDEGYTNQSGNDGYLNQGYRNSGDDDYINPGYKSSGNDGYMNQGTNYSGSEDYMNQGYKSSGQDNSILQQTGGGVMNMAKGAAAGAANIAQGAATAVKNTLGMNTDNSSTTTTGTNEYPSNPHTRV